MDTEEMMRINDMNMYTPMPYMPYCPMMQQMPMTHQMPMQGQMAPGMMPGMTMPGQMMPGVYLTDDMSDMTPGMMMPSQYQTLPGYPMEGMRYSDEDKVNISEENIEEKVDENNNIENEDEDDYMGYRAPQDVDRILRLIERNNPAITRRLINAGIPPYEATRIIRRIIALTLSYARPYGPPGPGPHVPPYPPHR